MWVSTLFRLSKTQGASGVYLWVISVISRRQQVELLGLRGSSQRCCGTWELMAGGGGTPHRSHRGDGRMTTAHRNHVLSMANRFILGFKWTQSKECIGIDWEYDGDITNKMIWRFPKSWGYPIYIIHFHGIFHEINHPAIGGKPIDGNPQMDDDENLTVSGWLHHEHPSIYSIGINTKDLVPEKLPYTIFNII